MDSINANSISTFGGNPLSTVGALANLQYALDHDLQTNAKKVGEHLMGGLRELQQRFPFIGDVRGKGLMIGIELVQPGTDKKPNLEATAGMMEETRERGLLIGKGGIYGSVVRIAPPMTVTLEEADEALAIMAEACDAVQGTDR